MVANVVELRDDQTKKPWIPKVTEKPWIQHETKKPKFQEETEKPQVQQETEKPRIEQETENPRIEQETEKPRRIQIFPNLVKNFDNVSITSYRTVAGAGAKIILTTSSLTISSLKCSN